MTALAGPVLRDIHLPAEPSWWPPAPGWWLLAAVALAVMAWLAWRALRRARLQRRRRRLRAAWAEAVARHAPEQGAALVAELSLLLRRAAKRHAPKALALQGEAWLEFLDAGDPQRPFRDGAGRLLLDGPYRPHLAAAEAQQLAELVGRRLERFVTVHDA
jgi:hypothetical protein